MTQEEYNGLKQGDRVWCFRINFNTTLYGTLSVGLIAELEKTDGNSFRVIRVKKGTSTKTGRIMYVYSYQAHELFKNYNDGLDYWNSVVHNEVDRLTHYFEEAVKRANEKLLKKVVT